MLETAAVAQQQCEAFLKEKRIEVITYIRNTWLEFLFGDPICKELNFSRVSDLPDSWKADHIQDGPSRHQMRSAYALGDIRWGLAILEASTRFGEEIARTSIMGMYQSHDGDVTIAEILPEEHFGKHPLGEEFTPRLCAA